MFTLLPLQFFASNLTKKKKKKKLYFVLNHLHHGSTSDPIFLQHRLSFPNLIFQSIATENYHSPTVTLSAIEVCLSCLTGIFTTKTSDLLSTSICRKKRQRLLDHAHVPPRSKVILSSARNCCRDLWRLLTSSVIPRSVR